MEVLRDLLLLKVEQPPDKTASGLLIVEEWKTLPPYGFVLAMGPDVHLPYVDSKGNDALVKVGDRVMFERYASIILENDERICKAAHIQAVANAEE